MSSDHDAAMDYAITDEPVPEELLADPEFAESYETATAELDLIRRGLHALAAQTPSSTDPDDDTTTDLTPAGATEPADTTDASPTGAATATSAAAAAEIPDRDEPLARIPPVEPVQLDGRAHWLGKLAKPAMAIAACLGVLIGAGWLLTMIVPLEDVTNSVGDPYDQGAGAAHEPGDSGPDADQERQESADDEAQDGSGDDDADGEVESAQGDDEGATEMQSSLDGQLVACSEVIALGWVKSAEPAGDGSGELIVDLGLGEQLRPAGGRVSASARILVDSGDEWELSRDALFFFPEAPASSEIVSSPTVIWLDVEPDLVWDYVDWLDASGPADPAAAECTGAD